MKQKSEKPEKKWKEKETREDSFVKVSWNVIGLDQARKTITNKS